MIHKDSIADFFRESQTKSENLVFAPGGESGKIRAGMSEILEWSGVGLFF